MPQYNRTRILCPNHEIALTSLPFPLKSSGAGICPISGAQFTFTTDIDETKLVQDKFGNLTPVKTYIIDGQE